jgi:hypothetical protein
MRVLNFFKYWKVSIFSDYYNSSKMQQNISKEHYLSIREASKWASKYLDKQVSESNISYLIQYGRVQKLGSNGSTLISKEDLKRYYDSTSHREIEWKKKLGDDLNWNLSFDTLREVDTTKHVHRLHPYKGKFIPQLVEYFIDDHLDDFKKEIYFNRGDILLDPFCGSGTALVQANELGINAIGIDISEFNSLISNIKVSDVSLVELGTILGEITQKLQKFVKDKNINSFEKKLLEELSTYNKEFFPSPDYRYNVKNGLVDEKEYGKKYESQFLDIYKKLVKEFNIDVTTNSEGKFIDKWLIPNIREEINFILKIIENVENENIRKVLKIILSRTARTCRATSHSDLATLLEPITSTYYCHKHGKICKPLFTTMSWWKRYTKDTLSRLSQFKKLKTKTFQYCFTGDSRTLDIEQQMLQIPELTDLYRAQKIKGIFSSPPYVGLIDYHEQHAYAYDIFKCKRNDDGEIGPLFKGQGKEARDSYVKGISDVLNNCKKYLADDYHVFLVANDKYNLYPTIAELSGMQIVNKFKRPVLNRTEKDKGAYSEIIFHLKQS